MSSKLSSSKAEIEQPWCVLVFYTIDKALLENLSRKSSNTRREDMYIACRQYHPRAGACIGTVGRETGDRASDEYG